MNEPDEPWRGHIQRSNLKGFARLKAVLWPRSLRVVEICTLGRHSWYWKLRWKLWRAFSGLDLHDQSRLSGLEDIFGETPLLTVVRLVETARSVAPSHTKSFVDLGSGRGTACLAAAALGYESVGFERESEWTRRANAVAQDLGYPCRFAEADFLVESWPQSGLIFVVATAFSDEVRAKILQRFQALKPGSILVTGDWSIDDLKEIWSANLPVDWGVIPFRIYESES